MQQALVLTGTRRLAVALRQEVVLIAPNAVVLERRARATVRVVVVARRGTRARAGRQRHRAGVRGCKSVSSTCDSSPPPGQQMVDSGSTPTWHQKLTGQLSLFAAEQNTTCPLGVVAGWPMHGLV